MQTWLSCRVTVLDEPVGVCLDDALFHAEVPWLAIARGGHLRCPRLRQFPGHFGPPYSVMSSPVPRHWLKPRDSRIIWLAQRC